MVKRVIPQCMQVEKASGAELARIENTQEGICPICHKPMKVTEANGIPAYVCLEDVVTMPIKDV